MTADEVGRAGVGIPDEEQLVYAGLHERVMVTEDLRFVPPVPHGGVLVIRRPLSIGAYIDYLELDAHTYMPDELRNLVRYYDL